MKAWLLIIIRSSLYGIWSNGVVTLHQNVLIHEIYDSKFLRGGYCNEVHVGKCNCPKRSSFCATGSMHTVQLPYLRRPDGQFLGHKAWRKDWKDVHGSGLRRGHLKLGFCGRSLVTDVYFFGEFLLVHWAMHRVRYYFNVDNLVTSLSRRLVFGGCFLDSEGVDFFDIQLLCSIDGKNLNT